MFYSGARVTVAPNGRTFNVPVLFTADKFRRFSVPLKSESDFRMHRCAFKFSLALTRCAKVFLFSPSVIKNIYYLFEHFLTNITKFNHLTKQFLMSLYINFLFFFQNDTMRVMWAFHASEPVSGAVAPGSLPYGASVVRGTRSLFLGQRVNQSKPPPETNSRVWELRNPEVELPQGEDTLYWCRVFKLPESINKKSHMIRVSHNNNTYIRYIDDAFKN